MADYTVSVVGDYVHALAYAQEIYATNWSASQMVPEADAQTEPVPPPTVEQMPQVLMDADLNNRLREMEQVAARTVPTLQGITDEATREQVLVGMVQSPAIQAYIRSKL